MNHNSRNMLVNIKLFLTQSAFVLIDKFTYELINLFLIQIWYIFSLSKEISSWVFKFLHRLYFKII